MTAPIVKVMVANKLPATVLAQVFLLVIAGFAVSLYILPTATGTANGILSFHTSNIPCLRCFLFARRLPAYILGHHPRFFQYFGGDVIGLLFMRARVFQFLFLNIGLRSGNGCLGAAGTVCRNGNGNARQ